MKNFVIKTRTGEILNIEGDKYSVKQNYILEVYKNVSETEYKPVITIPLVNVEYIKEA